MYPNYQYFVTDFASQEAQIYNIISQNQIMGSENDFVGGRNVFNHARRMLFPSSFNLTSLNQQQQVLASLKPNINYGQQYHHHYQHDDAAAICGPIMHRDFNHKSQDQETKWAQTNGKVISQPYTISNCQPIDSYPNDSTTSGYKIFAQNHSSSTWYNAAEYVAYDDNNNNNNNHHNNSDHHHYNNQCYHYHYEPHDVDKNNNNNNSQQHPSSPVANESSLSIEDRNYAELPEDLRDVTPHLGNLGNQDMEFIMTDTRSELEEHFYDNFNVNDNLPEYKALEEAAISYHQHDMKSCDICQTKPKRTFT